MGTFLTPNGSALQSNSTNQGIVWLHSAATLTFDYIEARSGPGPDARKVVSQDPAKLKVNVVARSASKLTFTLSATAADVIVVDGFSAAGTASGGLVVVTGDFQKHSGMEIDLLADICRGSDSNKILLVQQLLYSDSANIFDQNNAANMAAHGNLACGIVVKASAEALFGKINPISYENPYHQPLKAVTKRSDVKYRSSTIVKVRNAIARLLRAGTPVRVGVLDSPINMHVTGNKLYAYYAGGHTVLIVGCSSNNGKFLYIDPWASGSQLKYSGGFTGHAISAACQYLGTLEAKFDASRAVEFVTTEPNLIMQTSDSEGTFKVAAGNYLEIVSGPLVPPF